jgi:uncharacterized protein YoxC
VTLQMLLTTGLCAGVLAVFPSAALALAPRACVAGPPTAASYTWNFQKEADGLLQGLQNQAQQVQRHAATLRTFARTNDVDWQAHSDQLRQVKTEIDDMGKKLCRLTTIRRVLAPWQQQAVDRIGPQVRLAADNAEDAINFMNSHEETLWEPTYRMYVRNLYNEAHQVSNTVDHFQEYARAQHEYRVLAKDLERAARRRGACWNFDLTRLASLNTLGATLPRNVRWESTWRISIPSPRLMADPPRVSSCWREGARASRHETPTVYLKISTANRRSCSAFLFQIASSSRHF